MAYDSKNLNVLAYVNGFTLWHYTTTDTVAEVDKANYFNGSYEMARVGDIILTIIFANVNTDDVVEAAMFLINAKANGIVDVVNMTSFSPAEKI